MSKIHKDIREALLSGINEAIMALHEHNPSELIAEKKNEMRNRLKQKFMQEFKQYFVHGKISKEDAAAMISAIVDAEFAKF